MDLPDTVKLLDYIAHLFPTFQWEPESAPKIAAAWHETGLASVNLYDAKRAAQLIAQRKAFVSLADLLAEVARIRRERLDRQPVPDPGTGDPQLYRQRIQQAIARTADGLHVDTPRALAPGKRRQGPPPPEWLHARGLDPDEQAARAVDCPWCQAEPHQSCVNPLGNTMRRSHDSRVQLGRQTRELRAQQETL